MAAMSHQQRTKNGPGVPPEARAVLPIIGNSHRKALEELGSAFTEFRPLAILISEGKSAASSVIRNFLDGIGDDVAVARVPAANSNAIAGMREIIRAIGFDPKHMSVSEMENVFRMFLSYQMAHHRRTIICVDEAPDDGQWVLDRVQQLVKLEIEGRYGLMVVLSGRPGLNELLKEHPLNVLAADSAKRISIAPLSRDETQEYVRRRSEGEDISEVDPLLERHAIDLLHKLSRGVPDAVKKLYGKCLHVANKEKSAEATAAVVKTAAKQPRHGRTTQLSDLPARTIKGNGSSPAIGRLIVHMNGEIIQTQVLKQDHILIGRSRTCDLRLVPNGVSRHHAMVVNSSNGTELVDLRSTNGTFVDSCPIKHYPLRDNDAISIGGCMIRYTADDNP